MKADIQENEIEGVAARAAFIPYTPAKTPHVVEDRAVWAQPVRTAAPFRRHEVRASVADDGGSVTLVEDGLFARNMFALREWVFMCTCVNGNAHDFPPAD